ncbi:hypothetical protein ACOTJD_09910 [Achromobacter xylosoxidans]
MTEQQAIDRLNALTSDDPEAAHGEAEDILCEFLADGGYAAVVEAFLAAAARVGFWYA